MSKLKKVTVLMEKYCDLNPSLGTTSAYSNIVGSLISANIDHSVFHYDEYLINTGTPIDGMIIEWLKENKSDLLAVSYYPFHDSRNVNLDTFRRIRDELGIPVVFIWFDFIHGHIYNLAVNVTSAASLSVVVDTVHVPEERFLSMWVPQDERIFSAGNSKEIDVSFVGTTSGYTTRINYINWLKSRIPLHVSGGQREHKLTIEQYADILKKSKITLNFPDKPDGSIQAKCRIYETMLSGTLLLEKENNAIQNWFAPMEHYIPFTSCEDLLNKIHHYLTNKQDYERIVSNAMQKMKTDYSSNNWWTKVFEKVSQ